MKWFGNAVNFVVAFAGVLAIGHFTGHLAISAGMSLYAALLWGQWMYECGKDVALEKHQREKELILEDLHAAQRELDKKAN